MSQVTLHACRSHNSVSSLCILEQELFTLLEHQSCGVRVVQCLVFCVYCFVDHCLSCLLTIVLSLLLRFTTSDYSFSILKLFLLVRCDKLIEKHISALLFLSVKLDTLCVRKLVIRRLCLVHTHIVIRLLNKG